jgi:hypothetical protein
VAVRALAGRQGWRACNQEEAWQVDKVGIGSGRGLKRQAWQTGTGLACRLDRDILKEQGKKTSLAGRYA